MLCDISETAYFQVGCQYFPAGDRDGHWQSRLLRNAVQVSLHETELADVTTTKYRYLQRSSSVKNKNAFQCTTPVKVSSVYLVLPFLLLNY
jgi:hypothetical protein